MTQYALQFTKDGLLDPAYSVIPADTPPADELECFLGELDKQGVDHKETSPGVHEVYMLAGQKWRVQIVAVGLLDDTQPIEVAS
jgi:hypothetical protein